MVKDRNNTTIAFQSNKKNLADPKDAPPLQLSIDNFNFAVNLQYSGTDPTVLSWFNQEEIDRYFQMNFLQITINFRDKVMPNRNMKDISATPLGSRKC